MIDYVGAHWLSMVIGMVLSVGISLFAYKKRSLAYSGFIAAILMGIVISISGGYYFILILMMFFISSSLLSKFAKTEHKDSLRTYKQVLANGLVATIMSVLYMIQNDELYKLLFTISFAVSTADTWSSEVGKLSSKLPRHILSFQKLDTGLSGGITLLGTLAALLGSLFISAFYRFHIQVILWGFLGSIIDSILGTIQIKYVLASGKVLDQPDDQEAHVSTKGLAFLSNNLVNFTSNVVVVLIAFLVLR